MTPSPRRLPIALLGAILLAAVTAAATIAVVHHERSSAAHQQQRLAEQSVGLLHRALTVTSDRLVDLGSLLATAPDLPQHRFQAAAGHLLSTPALASVSYVRSVPASQRAAYERRHGPIVADTRGTPSGPRLVYYPVVAVVSHYPGAMIGFDEGAAPHRLAAMQAATDLATTRATTPLMLANGTGTGIVLFTPVYRSGISPTTVAARRADAIGYAVGVYHLRDVQVVVASLVPPNVAFSLGVDGVPAVARGARMSHPLSRAVVGAGHRWTVTVSRPAPNYGSAWTIVIAGTLLTIALGLLIFQASRRERYALELVAVRMAERDHAEAELGDIERRHRLLADNATDLILVIDRSGAITYASPACHELIGYAPEEVIGHRPDEFVHPEDRDEVVSARMRVVDEDGTVTVTSRLRHRDGHYVWTEARVRRVLDAASGEALEGQAIVRDITERVTADQALRESVERLAGAEQRFRTAFEAAPIGMALSNLEGRFIQINDALCAITGYTRDELADMSFSELSHPGDVSLDEEMMRSLLSGEQSTYWMEKRFVDVVGQVVWVSVHATLVRASDGTPQHFLGQIQDVSERVRYEAQLQHMADHDPLTGLLNRRSFERELNQHIRQVERYGPEGAALVLDIDRFKHINDTLGHNVGDELIVKVAQTLRARLRDSDVLARLGGDEFAVLLPRGGAAEAEAVAQAILAAVKAQAVVTPAGRRRSITASIGVALFADTERLTAEDLLVNADLAMYDAKEAGRDRASTFTHHERGASRMKARITWAERIREALEEDRFTLYAQPIVELQSGEVRQHELLLRMLDEHNDVIPPAAFINTAERFDLMQEIDRWVVSRAIRHMGEQRRAGRDLVFEVNISGSSTGDPDLLTLIERELHTSEIDPVNLVLEVTETVAVANIPRAQQFAARLAELGCRFALDDFGAGFGSFYYLKHLPFDILKIDGEFVRSCTTSQTDQLLIRAAVDIARGMGKQTIAEYVGDHETLELLRRLGVDYAQGFHIGRPAPLHQHLALGQVR
jgi:diguanylate cyclase (GGDEF)-like protein/PAS domain S-box-containing protein